MTDMGPPTRSYRIELSNEPTTLDFVEGDAHAGSAVCGSIAADDEGLVDEYQHLAVFDGC